MDGTSHTFDSHGSRCCGTLCKPSSSETPHPIVIMAHGFAAEMTYGLDPFAKRFLDLGLAVFLFDYRSFGDSEGNPRNDVHPWRHVQDWHAALAYVSTLPEVNASQIILWGSSFSGGHVLAVATQNQTVCAVIAQVPHVNGPATLFKKSVPDLIKATGLAGLDVIRRGLRLSPHYVPVASPPGRFAAMNAPGAYDGFSSLIPPGVAWENKVPARSLLMVPFYSPGQHAKNITCPTFILAGRHDTITPGKHARHTAQKIPDCDFHELDCGHFEVYSAPMLIKNLSLQEAFLKERVLKH